MLNPSTREFVKSNSFPSTMKSLKQPLNPRINLFLTVFGNLGAPPRNKIEKNVSLREKCPYSEFFWSVFSSILSQYGEIRISPYSDRMWENTDQKNNSKYEHFSRSGYQLNESKLYQPLGRI